MKLVLRQINRPSSIISRPSSFIWNLVSIMNHLLSKKQLNNEKNRQIRGKIIKSSMTFNENKPNLSEDKLGAKHFSTRIYETLPAWRSKKQTQYKPNSNPIPKRPRMNVNIYYTKEYNNETHLMASKTNPNKAKGANLYPRDNQLSLINNQLIRQTQTNPKQTQFQTNRCYFHKSIVMAPVIRYTAGFITNRNDVYWTLTYMIVTQILRPNCVKVPVENNEKEAAITELVDLLDSNGLLLDRDVALDAVLTRERIRSTGTGAGIAIPHGKCNAVKELVMAIGIAHEPIEFGSVDGKPVRILILLVSPADQTGPHIQALAGISRLMLNEEFKQKLQQAASADEVYGLLNEIDK